MKLTFTIEIESAELQKLLEVVENFAGTKQVYVEAKLAPISLEDSSPAPNIPGGRHSFRRHRQDEPRTAVHTSRPLLTVVPPAAYRAAVAVLVGGPVIAIIARIFATVMIAS